MLAARPGKQLVARVENDVGVLDGIARRLSERGLNILALHGAGHDGTGEIRLVTDDNLRAREALEHHGCAVEEEPVVTVRAAHKPGILRHITERLAHGGIDIRHIHASALLAQEEALVVVQTSNDERAAVLLND